MDPLVVAVEMAVSHIFPLGSDSPAARAFESVVDAVERRLPPGPAMVNPFETRVVAPVSQLIAGNSEPARTFLWAGETNLRGG